MEKAPKQRATNNELKTATVPTEEFVFTRIEVNISKMNQEISDLRLLIIANYYDKNLSSSIQRLKERTPRTNLTKWKNLIDELFPLGDLPTEIAMLVSQISRLDREMLEWRLLINATTSLYEHRRHFFTHKIYDILKFTARHQATNRRLGHHGVQQLERDYCPYIVSSEDGQEEHIDWIYEFLRSQSTPEESRFLIAKPKSQIKRPERETISNQISELCTTESTTGDAVDDAASCNQGKYTDKIIHLDPPRQRLRTSQKHGEPEIREGDLWSKKQNSKLVSGCHGTSSQSPTCQYFIN